MIWQHLLPDYQPKSQPATGSEDQTLRPCADVFPYSKAGWIDELDAKLGRYYAPWPKKPR